MRVQWEQQNEEVDKDGFFLAGHWAFEADKTELAKMGAPDLETLEYAGWEATDRDAATIFATTTSEAFVAFLKESELGGDAE